MEGIPLWQDELEGLEAHGQASLPIGVDPEHDPDPSVEVEDTTRKANSAKRSIHNLARDTLAYGRYRSLDTLLVDVGLLYQYAPFNAMLALLQRPASRFLQPAHKWRENWKRPVRPNEHPIVMLQPGGPVMFLFDVSQTDEAFDSRPLPEHLDNPFAMSDADGAEEAVARLIENVKADGLRLLGSREGYSRAGCIWSYQRGFYQTVVYRERERERVPVRWESLYNSSYSATERLATIAHELGHLYCGHVGSWDPDMWPNRRRLDDHLKELEAESVARVVFSRRFPGVDMPPYRGMSSGTDIPGLPDVSLELVMRAATWVVQDTLGPRRHPSRCEYKRSRHPLPRMES